MRRGNLIVSLDGGLPTCSQRRLRNTKSAEALAACRPALIGHGWLESQVAVRNGQLHPFRRAPDRHRHCPRLPCALSDPRV